MSINHAVARLLAVAAISGGAFALSTLPAAVADTGMSGNGRYTPADNDWGVAPSQTGDSPVGGVFAPADNEWGITPSQNGGAPGDGG